MIAAPSDRRIWLITGTSTDVGKTVAAAALAAAAGASGIGVGVCKPVQTGVGPDGDASGEGGDLAHLRALVGDVPATELVRYRDPLAPETAARREGRVPLGLTDFIDGVLTAAAAVDLLLVEGAGGVLVRLAPQITLLDIGGALRAAGAEPAVLVVTGAGLGTLNHTELTVRAVDGAGLAVAGLVLGSWPEHPDLAEACNREDLPRLTGVPIVGAIPSGVGNLPRHEFTAAAPTWIDPRIFDSPQPEGAPHDHHR